MSVLEPIRSRRSGTAGLARGNEWSWFNHARYDSQKRLLNFGVLSGGMYEPAYTYVYDSSGHGGTNQMGRLATISYNAAAADTVLETYSYTAAGLTGSKDFAVTRPQGMSQYTAHLKLSYTWDSEGRQLTMTTPARTFNYAYDAMERATGMTDTLGNTYVSGVQYGAANQLLQITYDDGPADFFGGTETRTYNSLLQLTGISSHSVSMQYNYNAGQNNGKIASAVNYSLSGEQVVYTYDSLNRLIQAQTAANPSVTQWGQQFVYDGFGNLYEKNVTAGSAPSISYSVDPTTNRLQGLGYDANGNATYPPTGGPLTYDFLNRVVTAPNGVAYSYL